MWIPDPDALHHDSGEQEGVLALTGNIRSQPWQPGRGPDRDRAGCMCLRDVRLPGACQGAGLAPPAIGNGAVFNRYDLRMECAG